MALQCIRQREDEYMESSATSNRAMMTVGCSATPNKRMVRCHVISLSLFTEWWQNAPLTRVGWSYFYGIVYYPWLHST